MSALEWTSRLHECRPIAVVQFQSRWPKERMRGGVGGGIEWRMANMKTHSIFIHIHLLTYCYNHQIIKKNL